MLLARGIQQCMHVVYSVRITGLVPEISEDDGTSYSISRSVLCYTTVTRLNQSFSEYNDHGSALKLFQSSFRTWFAPESRVWSRGLQLEAHFFSI